MYDVFANAHNQAPIAIKATDVSLAITNINPTLSSNLKNKQENALNLLAQNIEIKYKVPLYEVFEITTSDRGYVTGHSNGTCHIEHIAGPTPIIYMAYSILGDTTQILNNIITVSYALNNCKYPKLTVNSELKPNPLSMICCFMTNFSYRIEAKDMMISDSCDIKFSKLNIEANSITKL